jgi:hypothetical protein
VTLYAGTTNLERVGTHTVYFSFTLANFGSVAAVVQEVEINILDSCLYAKSVDSL